MVNVIVKGKHCRVVVMDSVAHMERDYKGDIIICGSHGGRSAAKYLIRFAPGGAIFNDAGKGKKDAGIRGLDIFSKAGLPAATVDAFSARIGDGMDTYKSGIISAVNQKAIDCGIHIETHARDAAFKMLKLGESIREADNLHSQ